MGLFSKLFGKNQKSVDLEDFVDKINAELGIDDKFFEDQVQLGLAIDKSIVKCNVCGAKFVVLDGSHLFRTMAKEGNPTGPKGERLIMCDKCYSIFTYRTDYENKTIELTGNVTHEKEKYLQEKYL
jgi:uncharacterized C2H2 Zn-finger protein